MYVCCEIMEMFSVALISGLSAPVLDASVIRLIISNFKLFIG